MKGSAKVVKGRIEEAVGELTGNEKLRFKGQKDQVIGQVTVAAEKTKDATLKLADQTKELAKAALAKAKGKA